MMNPSKHARHFAALIVIFCLLAAPVTAFAKKGEKNFKRGLQYEAALQWEKAAQEFALAVAADPSNMEYQLHYRRALFNASQSLMQQGRALSEQNDYVGAYNAFRQAYGYDQANELALSEMERVLRLQREKEGLPTTAAPATNSGNGDDVKVSPTAFENAATGQAGQPQQPRPGAQQQDQNLPPQRTEQLRVITFSGDLKNFIRSLAEQLDLNVVFDTQSFRQPRTIDINWRNVTTAQALDYLFQQEGLFFQRLGRRTILVADQTRRAQYQQLVIRTFYLANVDPNDARTLIQAAIPAQAGRPATVVIPDKATNSLTVRDTPENIRLIGQLLQSIDKDRAEVVMDVNIYEVSRSDLMQFGNQLGTDATLANLGGTGSGILSIGNRVAVTGPGGISPPTALGAALVLPLSSITALQRRDRTRLLASTQVHAFNGEESTARIGRRVPVQTAQTFPFGSTGTATPQGGTTAGTGFSGGFPVFNYEPTGLTLKFTPQVFPNQDVQVKMSIESKDVLNPGSLTPTFTERTLTGTARIQNNRTMMLASIAQDTQSNGRRGIPLLGLIPILGRLFTAPVSTNDQVDIVIAVTPRVLRAPAVTPADEEMRPSGSLQNPTSGSLEALLRDVEREDQLAAARRPATTEQQQQSAAARSVPNNVTIQLPDAEPAPTYVPAPKSLMGNTTATDNTAGISAAKALQANIQPIPASITTPTVVTQTSAPAAATTTPTSQATTEAANNTPVEPRRIEINSGMRPLSTRPTVGLDDADAGSASVQTSAPTPTREAARPPVVEKARAEVAGKPAATSAAELRLVPDQQEMRVGEKRRLALVLKTDAPLGLAVITLKFDPRTIKVNGISQGNLFAYMQGAQATITQSIDPSGLLLLSIAPPSGASPMTGAGVLVFIDIEAVATGESVVSFDKNNMHMIASDGRGVLLQLVQSRVTVKQ